MDRFDQSDTSAATTPEPASAMTSLESEETTTPAARPKLPRARQSNATNRKSHKAKKADEGVQVFMRTSQLSRGVAKDFLSDASRPGMTLGKQAARDIEQLRTMRARDAAITTLTEEVQIIRASVESEVEEARALRSEVADFRSQAAPGGRSNSPGCGHFKFPHLTTAG
ncbi:hypothetical protein LA345_12970 [Burkholderia vietnamiensis]|uniref:Uncharacterized protein n=1 Tax=Burkholderia vietnamiensis (strain G4 / LMG 22486) TaxID=269482 RepID=A4JFL1_BURVG|nr:hypothetical protein Bcep1808_2062 [Burkholderia vietnamiensis G4]MCB4344824.1 hypothetical protein [Burkholderia vietnamiensis]